MKRFDKSRFFYLIVFGIFFVIIYVFVIVGFSAKVKQFNRELEQLRFQSSITNTVVVTNVINVSSSESTNLYTTVYNKSGYKKKLDLTYEFIDYPFSYSKVSLRTSKGFRKVPCVNISGFQVLLFEDCFFGKLIKAERYELVFFRGLDRSLLVVNPPLPNYEMFYPSNYYNSVGTK